MDGVRGQSPQMEFADGVRGRSLRTKSPDVVHGQSQQTESAEDSADSVSSQSLICGWREQKETADGRWSRQMESAVGVSGWRF